ncbi:unnamed protein product [Lampetra planeri]
MYKHLKKKSPPVASSDDDDSVTPGAANPVNVTVAGAGAPSSSPHVEDGWLRVAEQLDSLLTILLQLVTLVASSAGTGRPQDVSPMGGEQRLRQGTLEGPHWESTAAITHAVDTTWQEAAILGAAVETRSEPAISSELRGEPPCRAAAAECGGVGRSHRLPHIKEFVVVGGDWSTFTWWFESAFRSMRWTEEEALGALPTVLDDQALAVFRAIPRTKRRP